MLRDCILFVFELCTGLVLELCTRALQTAQCLSLPTLVPQGYSALFVSILLVNPSKELIFMMKSWGYSVL